MKNLTKQEVHDLFIENQDGITYQKNGKFLVMFPLPDETVLTIVAGKLETITRTKEGDVILINIGIGSSAERYVINKDMFKKRYNKTDKKPHNLDGDVWEEVTAKGKVYGFYYEGKTVSFDAPWGEKMLLEPDDFLARPVGGDENDIYRIEKDTFSDTYVAL